MAAKKKIAKPRTEFYYLLRVAGDVEAEVVSGPFPHSELDSRVMQILLQNPGEMIFDQKDGLYLLALTGTQLEATDFSGGYMDDMRARAEIEYRRTKKHE